jgi:hypothetical protein
MTTQKDFKGKMLDEAELELKMKGFYGRTPVK